MKMIIPTFKAFTERKYYEAMLERDDWGEEKISVREIIMAKSRYQLKSG